MVYIFGMNGRAIVVGHGKKNRAKVICDDRDRLTATHIKSLFVRCCSIYGKGPFEKFIIPCDDKKSALKAERDIQDLIGGNVLRLPIKVEKQLFEGIKPGSMTDLLLRMAMASSFSGIADLLKWAHLGPRGSPRMRFDLSSFKKTSSSNQAEIVFRMYSEMSSRSFFRKFRLKDKF